MFERHRSLPSLPSVSHVVPLRGGAVHLRGTPGSCMTQSNDGSARRRVLVVDDEGSFLRYAARTLEARQLQCRLASSAREARSLLASETFDLLITDIHLPDGDGLELLGVVSRRAHVLPVVLVTGYPSVGTAVQALRLEAMDYLVKPATELAEHATRVLDRVDARRAQLLQPKARADFSDKLRELADFLRAEGFGRQVSEGEAGAQRKPDLLARLTAREAQIASGLLNGHPPADIAASLGISLSTVRNHLQSAYRKLGVRSQVEFIAKLNGQS